MLSSSHTLTTENVYYRDIDLDSADYKLPSDVHFQLRGSLSLGFRQLDNDRWPASPLYTLSIVEQELARKIAGNSVLSVKLKLAKATNKQVWNVLNSQRRSCKTVAVCPCIICDLN